MANELIYSNTECSEGSNWDSVCWFCSCCNFYCECDCDGGFVDCCGGELCTYTTLGALFFSPLLIICGNWADCIRHTCWKRHGGRVDTYIKANTYLFNQKYSRL